MQASERQHRKNRPCSLCIRTWVCVRVRMCVRACVRVYNVIVYLWRTKLFLPAGIRRADESWSDISVHQSCVRGRPTACLPTTTLFMSEHCVGSAWAFIIKLRHLCDPLCKKRSSSVCVGVQWQCWASDFQPLMRKRSGLFFIDISQLTSGVQPKCPQQCFVFLFF